MSTTDAANFAFLPIAAPGFVNFVTASVLMGAFVGFGSYVMLPFLLRKSMWVCVGAAYPILILLIAYGRLSNFEAGLPYTLIAVCMAGMFAAAVVTLNKQKDQDWAIAIVAYSSAATLTLALGLAFVLRDAWLSFAFTLEIVALGYIWRKMRIEGLRFLALGLGSVVMLRLFVNSAILSYGSGDSLPIFNWLFYGYALTAALFAYAARQFDRGETEDQLVSALKAGSALLAIAFTTLEIRVLVSEHSSLLDDVSALEFALQTINWTAATTILFLRETRDNTTVFKYLRWFMTALSILILFVLGGLANLFYSYREVGGWPILNVNLLQFLIPSALFAFKAWIARQEKLEKTQNFYGAVALFGVFVWISFELRHLFALSGATAISDWEWYSYSCAWLFYAVGLLALGIRLDEKRVRQAGLGVLALIVFKVFLLDMNHLEGIARALSFIGLGAALIGLGYLYQFFRKEEGDTDKLIQ